MRDDWARANALKEAGDALQFYLFLCFIAKNGSDEYGSESEDEFETDSEEETTYQLDGVLDPDGKLVMKMVPISENDILQNDLSNAEDDESELALLIIPNSELLQVFETAINKDNDANTETIVSWLVQKHHESRSGQQYLSLLGQFCSRMIDQKEMGLRGTSNIHYNQSSMLHVAKGGAEIKNTGLVKRAMACLRNGIDPRLYTHIRDILRSISFEEIEPELDLCIAKCKTIEGRCRALGNIFDEGLKTIQKDGRANPISNWAIEKIEELLNTRLVLSPKAFSFLVEFVVLMGGDGYLMSRIIPDVEKHASETPFAITLLNELRSSTNFPETTIKLAFEKVVPSLVQRYSLVRWSCKAFSTYSSGFREKVFSLKGWYPYSSPDTHISPIDGDKLAKFVQSCLYFELRDDALLLVDKFHDEVPQFDKADLTGTALPFLCGLTSALQEARISLVTPKCRTLYRTVFILYLEKNVGNEPEKLNNWSRNPAKCEYLRRPLNKECRNCETLNAFLRNPTEQVLDWKVAKSYHSHLSHALHAGKSDCESSTTRPGPNFHFLVKKTNRNYELEFRSWDERVKRAEAEIAKFDQDALKELLGEEYEEIVNMKKQRIPEVSVGAPKAREQSKHEDEVQSTTVPRTQTRPLMPADENIPRPNYLSGAPGPRELGKRKAEHVEMIDLTDDGDAKRLCH